MRVCIRSQIDSDCQGVFRLYAAMYCQRLISFSQLLQLEYEALNKLYSTLHIMLIVYSLHEGTVLDVVVNTV